MQDAKTIRATLLEKHQFNSPKSWNATRLQKELDKLSKPIVDKPIVDKPIVDEPIVDKPIVDEPIVDKPIVDKPIVDEPIVDKPIVDKPIVDEPIVDKPIVDEPIVEKTDELVEIEAKVSFTSVNQKITPKERGEKFKVSVVQAEYFVMKDRTCKYVK